MVAIGAKFRLASTLGERVIDAAGFYNDDGIDYLKKRPDELLVDIQLPPTNGWRASYQKLRRRGAFDFPVLGVAAYVRYRTGSGSDRAAAVEDARIILGGIAPSPIEVNEAAQTLIGKPLTEDQIQAAAEAAYVKARPLDNTDFVMNWRKQMARQYTLRALRELVAIGLWS
jgi:4-hydroxybenzoyl-CoA reductase subunit beta